MRARFEGLRPRRYHQIQFRLDAAEGFRSDGAVGGGETRIQDSKHEIRERGLRGEKHEFQESDGNLTTDGRGLLRQGTDAGI